MPDGTGAVMIDGKMQDDATFKQCRVMVDLARRLDTVPLRRVINATGVVVHTNLGRAPLAPEAAAAVAATAAGYADLELDLGTGQRGSRQTHLAPLLARLTGADDGIAVNNAAGALVLCLAALARDREVIVSRGQMIEIGDGFRQGSTNRDLIKQPAEVAGCWFRLFPRNHSDCFQQRNADADRSHDHGQSVGKLRQKLFLPPGFEPLERMTA